MGSKRVWLLILLNNLKQVLTMESYRIIGGRFTNKGEFPFLVSIQFRADSSSCGGNILNHLSVLTACHCTSEFTETFDLIYRNYANMRVIAGSLTRDGKGDEQGQQVRWVYYLQRHPSCRIEDNIWTYDIGVVIVSKPFIFNNLVQPSRIMNSSTLSKTMIAKWQRNQQTCEVAGWGFTFASGPMFHEVTSNASIYLRALAARLVPTPVCVDFMCNYGRCKNPYTHNVEKDRICAKSKFRKSGTVCGGDSGGPLICKGFIVGVVSYSYACGQLDDPVVYARVDEAYQFLSDYYYYAEAKSATNNRVIYESSVVFKTLILFALSYFIK